MVSRAMKRFELKACSLVLWTVLGCASIACEEKARLPIDGGATDTSSSGEASESLGPLPDVTSTMMADVAPEPVPCGQAERTYCGEPGESLGGGADQLSALSGCEIYRGSINLTDTDTTADLWGLSALRVIEGELRVGSADLETLQGLECLEQLGGLRIIGPPFLRDLSALQGASSEGLIYIIGSTVLPSLDGLEGFTAAPEVVLSGNTKLADLEGLSGLQRVETAVLLDQHPVLTDVSGLRNLVDFEGSLAIDRSEKLRHLDGLEQIHTLSLLRLADNPVLESLDGLAGLEHVTGDIELVGNPMLTTAEIDELLAHVVVDGEVVIQ